MVGIESAPPLDELWKAVQEQQTQLQEERAAREAQAAELAQLKRELAEKTALAGTVAASEPPAGRGRKMLSRGGLLKAAVAGAAGLAGAELAASFGATPALAADEQDNFEAAGGNGTAYYVGASSTGLTYSTSNYDYGLDARIGGVYGLNPPNIAGVIAAGQQVGVQASGPTGVQTSGGQYGVDAVGDYAGINASTTNGDNYAVNATSTTGYGVYAKSAQGTGVYGYGGSFGVWGESPTSAGFGVRGKSVSGFGVHGESDNNTGVIGTLRAYAPTGPGYLTAYPGSGTPPTASNVNFYPNPDYPTSYAVADQVTVGFYQNQLSIYVGGPPGSSTQVVFDVSGYIQ